MATKLEQLVLTISADTRQIQRSLKRLQADAGKSMSGIEKSSGRVEKSMVQLEGVVGRVGTNMKAFAVGLASGIVAGGVAAFTAAVTGAVSSLAEMQAQARRAGIPVEDFQALAYAAEQSRVGIDALTDGIKEMNLRADEFIVTGGGSAAEAFQRLGYDAKDLEQKLKDPVALFDEIITKLRTIDRTAAIRIADEVFGGTGGEQFVQLLDESNRSLEDLTREARQVGAVIDEEMVQRAAEIDRQFNKIATTIGTSVKSAIVDAAGALADFLSMPVGQNSATRMIAEGQGISGELFASHSLRRQLGGFERPGATFGEFSDILSGKGDSIQATTPVRPVAPAKSTRSGRSGGGRRSGGSSTDEFQREIEQSRQRTASILAEADALGIFAGNSDKASVYTDLLMAAQQAKKPLDEAMLELIRGQAEAQGQALATLDATRQRYDDLNATMQEISDTARDALGGFLGDLAHGAKLSDALRNSLSRVLDNVLQLSLNSLFDAGGKSGGSSVFGSILSGIFGGFKAAGGPVEAGKAYVVGERRPELFVPSTSGRIIPNMGNGGGGYRGGDTIVNIQGDASEKTVKIMQAMLARNNRELAYQNANSWRDQ